MMGHVHVAIRLTGVVLFDDPLVIEELVFALHVLLDVGLPEFIAIEIKAAIRKVRQPLFAIHIRIAFHQSEAGNETVRKDKRKTARDVASFLIPDFIKQILP